MLRGFATRARLRRSSAEAQGASSANCLALAHRLSGRELDTISCVPFRADYFRAASRSNVLMRIEKEGPPYVPYAISGHRIE